MTVLIVLIVFVLIGLIVLAVGAPLRRAAAGERRGDDPSPSMPAGEALVRRDELEAAREAKYREIRDAEMDFRTGKLSDADYGLLDGELRAEALKILDSLDALDEPQDAAEEG